MRIFFKAFGLDFEAEVDYIPETPDDNDSITVETLECDGKDAMFLFGMDPDHVYTLENAACVAAEKALKAHNDDMRLDAFIANQDLEP